jgi:hypothetical protein
MANKIQIKRSVANASVTGLANGELAFTQASNTLHIGLPDGSGVLRIGGAQVPGTLTANQALVANSTSGIDKIITSNAVISTLWANGGAGIDGQVLHSNGSAVYWSNTVADITAVIAGNGLTGGGSSGELTLDVGAGNGISVNSTAVAVVANNGIVANSTGVFALAANGISVDASGINVVGGSGLVSNTTGVHIGQGNGISVSTDSISVQQANGIIVNTGGVSIDAAGGLVANATGLHVGQGNGVAVDSDSIRVVAGTGVVSNATGVHIGQAVATTSNVTFANVVTGNLSVTSTVSSNLMPLANNTYHLGNTTIKWAQVHAANVHGITGIFDGNVEIAGDLIVTGNVTTTNVGSVVVADAKILLAANNPGDILDIGFSGTYTDGASVVRHAGLFRDASDNGVFKFFSNTVQDLTGNNVIDTGEASYAIGVLQTYLVSGGLSTNSTSANLIANSTYSVGIVANTLTLTTALVGTSGGTGRSTTTNNALLVGNSTNGYNELTLGTSGYVLQSNGTALVFDVLDGGTF